MVAILLMLLATAGIVIFFIKTGKAGKSSAAEIVVFRRVGRFGWGFFCSRAQLEVRWRTRQKKTFLGDKEGFLGRLFCCG